MKKKKKRKEKKRKSDGKCNRSKMKAQHQLRFCVSSLSRHLPRTLKLTNVRDVCHQTA